jgi:hypothetical protein
MQSSLRAWRCLAACLLGSGVLLACGLIESAGDVPYL